MWYLLPILSLLLTAYQSWVEEETTRNVPSFVFFFGLGGDASLTMNASESSLRMTMAAFLAFLGRLVRGTVLSSSLSLGMVVVEEEGGRMERRAK